jgi:hypothetical protein
MQLHVSALYVGHHQVVQRTEVTIQYVWYLSYLNNLMMAYIQGRNM